MKLQESYFNIKKISYPNSDTRHGKFRINLLAEHPVYAECTQQEQVCPQIYTLQMIKECAQIMAHEQLLFSYIKNYRLFAAMSPVLHPEIMIEIHMQQAEKEGTGNIYKMKAVGSKRNSPNVKFFDISAELSPIK